MTIVVSLMTKPIDKKHLYRLTYWSRNSTKVRVELEDDKGEEQQIVKKESEQTGMR